MYAEDFVIEDTTRLSDYGFVICEFNGDGGLETIGRGGNAVHEAVSRDFGRHWSILHSKYEDRLKFEFDICLDPDVNDDIEISESLYMEIMRWLIRNEKIKLRFVDDRRENVNHYGVFSGNRIEIGGRLYGIKLTFETDSPFGYGDEETMRHTFSAGGESVVVNEESTLIGEWKIPLMKITAANDGDINIGFGRIGENKRILQIKNCKAGEIIEINGDLLTVSTSIASHNVGRDFNWEFPAVSNIGGERRNKITAGKACGMEIRLVPRVYV